MTIDPTSRTLLARLRQWFPGMFRQRHVAVIEPERAPAPKLEPIAKILSDTGRDRAAPVD
jgi:hypothetical protein